MDSSSIVQEHHTQGSDENADIHSQMSITGTYEYLLVILWLSLFIFVVSYACMYLLAGVEISTHASPASSTTNQPQPASTSLGVDTDEELSGEPTCDSFS